jgi:hypothetical protein
MFKDENSSGKQKAMRIIRHTPKILVPTGTYATATRPDTPTCPPYIYIPSSVAILPAVCFPELFSPLTTFEQLLNPIVNAFFTAIPLPVCATMCMPCCTKGAFRRKKFGLPSPCMGMGMPNPLCAPVTFVLFSCSLSCPLSWIYTAPARRPLWPSSPSGRQGCQPASCAGWRRPGGVHWRGRRGPGGRQRQ